MLSAVQNKWSSLGWRVTIPWETVIVLRVSIVPRMYGIISYFIQNMNILWCPQMVKNSHLNPQYCTTSISSRLGHIYLFVAESMVLPLPWKGDLLLVLGSHMSSLYRGILEAQKVRWRFGVIVKSRFIRFDAPTVHYIFLHTSDPTTRKNNWKGSFPSNR